MNHIFKAVVLLIGLTLTTITLAEDQASLRAIPSYLSLWSTGGFGDSAFTQIYNDGNVDAKNIWIMDTCYGDFTLSHSCYGDLKPGQSCMVSVYYRPFQAGFSTCQIQFSASNAYLNYIFVDGRADARDE